MEKAAEWSGVSGRSVSRASGSVSAALVETTGGATVDEDEGGLFRVAAWH